MPSIAKLGHVAMVTKDIDKSLWFWRDVIGLDEVGNDGETVFLRAWGEFEHHSLSLTEGPESRIDHIGWRCGAAEDVGAYAALIEESGIAVTHVDGDTQTGHGDAIRFTAPGAFPYEFYFEVDKPHLNGERTSRLKNQSGKPHHHGISPRRIDHVNMRAADVKGFEDWHNDFLGFKTREYITMPDGTVLGTWQSVTTLVHDVAIVLDPDGRDGQFHHVAFYLDNWQDILRAMDILSEHEIKPDLGPGRHGISQAFFCYVTDPGSGIRVELFSGGYQIFDPDWEPIEWKLSEADYGVTYWGADYVIGELPAMDRTVTC
jgi:catechol 2,3 dioxygenase